MILLLPEMEDRPVSVGRLHGLEGKVGIAETDLQQEGGAHDIRSRLTPTDAADETQCALPGALQCHWLNSRRAIRGWQDAGDGKLVRKVDLGGLAVAGHHGGGIKQHGGEEKGDHSSH